jgi:hypothetical protein
MIILDNFFAPENVPKVEQWWHNICILFKLWFTRNLPMEYHTK